MIDEIMTESRTRLSPDWKQEKIKKYEAVYVVPKKFVQFEPLGVGSYSTVCRAIDNEARMKVAIKKVAHLKSVNLAKRIYREIQLLRHLDHENIIRLIEVFTDSQTAAGMQNVYLVTEYMYCDLDQILKTQVLTEYERVLITYQLLAAVKYLHTSNIIHRDLKPSSICLSKECDLRLIDFGLSRTEALHMTQYVTTRWYRAPELLIDPSKYTKKVDMWSVGCIIAELFTNVPLFPGETGIIGRIIAMDQLQKILRIMGYPNEELLQTEFNHSVILDQITDHSNENKIEHHLKKIENIDAFDLVMKLLYLEPSKRLDAIEALNHPYVKKYHDEKHEPSGQTYVPEFESENLTLEEWNTLIFKQVNYHPN